MKQDGVIAQPLRGGGAFLLLPHSSRVGVMYPCIEEKAGATLTPTILEPETKDLSFKENSMKPCIPALFAHLEEKPRITLGIWT